MEGVWRMEGVLRIAISNAALATPAALLAWSAGRWIQRPALTHALWLLVLLKLITPPFWTVPLHWSESQTRAVSFADEPPPKPTALILPERMVLVLPEPAPKADLADAPVVDVAPPLETKEAPAALPDLFHEQAMELPAAKVPAAPPPVFPWRQWIWPAIGWVWAGGSVLCLAIMLLRVARFHRTLRHAALAPADLQERMIALSRQMGIRRAPDAWLVPGAVCPMLWGGFGRARVLLPRGLWGKLDERQRRTLLVHELAHLVRRDHWVRWLELVVTALYWWNPVCWWARHGLREAEEQCCDAWVLWMEPGSFRDYASALLEAVDFVSAGGLRQTQSSRGGAPRRDSVPTLASGMGQFGHLKRRLTMLKTGDVARALGWGGLSTAIGLGALLLPISATWGQESKAEEKPAPKIETHDTQYDQAVAVQTEVTSDKKATAPETTPPADALPVPAPVAVAPVAVAPVAPVAPTPPAAPEEPVAVEKAPPSADDPKANADEQFRRSMADLEKARAQQQVAAAQLDQARRQVDQLRKQLNEATARLKQLEKASKAQNMSLGKMNLPGGVRIVQRPDGTGGMILTTPDGKTIARFDAGMAEKFKQQPDQFRQLFRFDSGSARKPASSDDDREKRMQKIEQELSALMQEVRDMRHEARDSRREDRGSRRDEPRSPQPEGELRNR